MNDEEWVYEVVDSINERHSNPTIVLYKNKKDAIDRFNSMVNFHRRWEPQNFVGIEYEKEREVGEYDDESISGLPYAEFKGKESNWFITVTARRVHSNFLE